MTKLEFFSQIYYNLEFDEYTFDHFRHLQDVFKSDDFLKFITQEIHMMSYHVIEVFFSLFFALRERDEEHLWLKLSFSEDKDVRGFLLYDQISDLKTKYDVQSKLLEENENGIEYWKFLFYPIYSFPASIDQKKLLDDLSSIISKLASRFSSRELYNAYKHGLRLFDSGKASVNFAPESSPGVTSGPFRQMMYTPQSFVHLINKQRSVSCIDLKTTAISTKEDIFLIENTLKLIENIIYPRRSTTGQVEVNTINLSEKPPHEGNFISSAFPMVDEITILNKARVEYNNKKYSKAQVSSSAVLRINEKNYTALGIRAASQYYQENYKQAREDFDTLIAKYEADPSLNPQWVNLLYWLSECNYYLGNEAESVKQRQKFVEKYDPNLHNQTLYNSTLQSLVEHFFQKNQETFQAEKRNSKKDLQKALKYQKLFDPDFKDRNTYYKILYFLSKVRISKVKETYTEMMRVHPSNSMIKLNYSVILHELEEFSERDKLFSKVDPISLSSEELEFYEKTAKKFNHEENDE